MDNDTEFTTAHERLRLARERAAAAEMLVSGAREELGAAAANLERLRAGWVTVVADEMQASTAQQPMVRVNAPQIGDGWPYRTPTVVTPVGGASESQPVSGELQPPSYKLRPPTYRTDSQPQVTRHPAPAAWQSRRTGTTWGVPAIAVAASLLFHWLSQIVIGALVGATIGLEGLARITGDDFKNLSVMVIVSTLSITMIVLPSSAIRTYRNLEWLPDHPRPFGMSWWRDCWAPILLGTAAYASIFWVAFVGVTAAYRAGLRGVQPMRPRAMSSISRDTYSETGAPFIRRRTSLQGNLYSYEAESSTIWRSIRAASRARSCTQQAIASAACAA